MKEPEIMKTTLSHIQISDDTDALLIIRTSSAEPWDVSQEDKAVQTHDSVYRFLADCIKNKKEVYALLKGLKS